MVSCERGPSRAGRAPRALALSPLLLLPLAALAQPASSAGWQACANIADGSERLACYDRWAAGQGGPVSTSPVAASTPAPAPASAATTPVSVTPPALASQHQAVQEPRSSRFDLRISRRDGCRDPSRSAMSRFWELEPESECGNFDIRGYRPISLSVVTADTVNRQPTSGNPLNNATTSQPYGTEEMRLQLSVRTKLAKDILTGADPTRMDSLWFGYTQQSYWQLFNGGISRPFRSTDHEPEVMYVYPLQAAQPGRWRLRYAGLGWAHQSNGQSLPLSRSWNRAYAMAGAEYGNWRVTGRLWKRTAESGGDDNPAIGDTVGRGELGVQWEVTPDSLLAATLRHSLRSSGRGSLRLEWLRTLGTDDPQRPGGLKLHTQVFSGYGDTLLDYNRKRTVFSVGMSLVDW